MKLRRLSVRARLFVALALLALGTLVVGVTSWLSLSQGAARMDRLHDDTLAGVEQALRLSRQASDLATRAPYLLTLESPFRIDQEAETARSMIAGISETLQDGAGPAARTLAQMRGDLDSLVAATMARAQLTDRVLRQTAELGRIERATSDAAAPPAGQPQLMLQRLVAAVRSASRSGNLVGVGELQREYNRILREMDGLPQPPAPAILARLRGVAEAPDGIFELRRLEIAERLEAEGALARIRAGAEAISLRASEASAAAQSQIADERAKTRSAIAFAKGVILVTVLVSALVALIAAVFVSGYVTGNLKAITAAMVRLAARDRSIRLPRGEHAGDEIGKLYHSFRAFRSNALRLDRLNRQLAQRNALFQNLYDAMSDGLAILSDAGVLIGHNSRLAEVLGLPVDSLTGRPAFAGLLDSAGWERLDLADGFAELRHADGRVVELREGRLATGGTVLLLSDASTRRELESRLRQVQRTEALGKIAGEVAHDFGNILSTISTTLHLMETAPPERATGLRQSLGSALDVGTSLTQRLLAFARRLNLEPEVVDLNHLVDGLEDLIALALTDAVSLTIIRADGPLTVRIDPGQMESALLNLCLNAAQAISGAGHITIRLSRGAPGQAIVEVADTGCGMAPDVLAHATEPFFTARMDGTGTGLGLATVYGFIRQSAGELTIDSTVGQGTTVRIALPIQIDSAPLAVAAGKVLIVEDDPADAAHARSVVRATHLAIAATVPDALRAIADNPPFDLVLTDLHIGREPGGWRVAEAALLRGPGTQVVVVSGRMPAVDPLARRFPGRTRAMTKPISPALLAATLQETV